LGACRDADAQAEEELKSSLDLFEIETLNMLMMAIEHSTLAAPPPPHGRVLRRAANF